MTKTPWYPMHIKPERVGVYETAEGVYQYWNGRWWGVASIYKSNALAYGSTKSLYQGDSWRGLAK